jgi:hypothetical protein
MAGEEQEGKGFTVIDRRHGRESESSASEPAPPRAQAGPAAPPGAEPPPARPSAGPLPAIDFATFLMSLSTSALVHLGLVPERGGAPGPPDLPMARQTIDILEILEEKTRGNLSVEEAHLLESLLYELRMHYVEAQRRAC